MLVIMGTRVGAALGILLALGSAVLHISTLRGHPVASVLVVYGFRQPV
jgi:hypothetical protein